MTERELLRQALPGLIAWYETARRPLPWREDPTPYHVWLSEIMLQQTRIEAAIPYYRRFLRELPTVEALAACDEGRLMKLWEGLGYYSRARNLQKTAKLLVAEYGGALPRTAAELRRLPGIGDYTAGAIASIACGQPEPAVDGNVLRVLMRLLGRRDDIMAQRTRKDTAALLREVYPEGRAAGLLTEGLMELGEVICIPNGEARCTLCPLAGFCRAYREGTVSELPVKAPPKPRRVEERTVLLLCCGGKFALRRREEKGLLAGLWEFPNLPGSPEEADIEGFAARYGLRLLDRRSLGPAKHIFTHVEWHMQGLLIDCEAPAAGLTWASPPEIDHEYALPTALKAYRSLVCGSPHSLPLIL